MSSSSEEFTINGKAQKQMFLLVSGAYICAPEGDTNMVSPYKAL